MSELVATEAFATTMPDSIEVGRGGDDPAFSVEGDTNGFGWRMLLANTDEAAIVVWHIAKLEADGWTPARYAYITMLDGRVPQHAWRRGDLVLGLGFPDRGSLHANYPVGTLYELTITYEPEDR